MSINCKLAFVGAGKMVSAIVHSLIRSKSFIPEEIACCSAADGTSDKLAKQTGVLRFDSIEEMLAASPSVLILGCKPQQINELPARSKSGDGAPARRSVPNRARQVLMRQLACEDGRTKQADARAGS